MAITQAIDPHQRDLGGGFLVRRLLPAQTQRSVGPFVFFDHFGPIVRKPTDNFDVRPHPHIGLATVTYLFEGAMLHRDSLGYTQRIEPSAINWMTAGRGIVHSERAPEDLRDVPHPVHGLQLWTALPADQEECDPAFVHTPATALPMFHGDGFSVRVLIGAAFGLRSPVATFAETLYLDIEAAPGAVIELPAGPEELALYVVDGELESDGAAVAPLRLMVLDASRPFTLRALTNARLVLVGGARVDAYRFMWWNFVSSRKERIEQAKADWRGQRLGSIPGETEFIPLPER